MEDAFEEAKRQQEYQRLEREKFEEDEKLRKYTKKFFSFQKNTRVTSSSFIFYAWIVAIIILKANGSFFGDILLMFLLASIAIGVVIAIIKKGIGAIPLIIGFVIGLIVSLIVGLVQIIKKIFKKDNLRDKE